VFFLSASQWAFYLFLAVVLGWVEVIAIRLRSVAEDSRAQQSSRVE
jgi:heme exporter protein D